MDPGFCSWLEERGLKQSSVATHISYARRVENHYDDLEELYDRNKLKEVLEKFQYSKDDEALGRSNPSSLDIDGNLYDSPTSYRAAVNQYREYRKTKLQQRAP